MEVPLRIGVDDDHHIPLDLPGAGDHDAAAEAPVDGLGAKGRHEPHGQEDEDERNRLAGEPPDILLTNYKMLDYLLLRPADQGVWQHNQRSTLRFLVVDEIHTFDGAQGTDLACLVRRLKRRLQVDDASLCCVGTSATIGDASGRSARKLTDFAQQIFDEDFFFHPAKRVEVERKMEQALYERWGRYGLGEEVEIVGLCDEQPERMAEAMRHYEEALRIWDAPGRRPDRNSTLALLNLCDGWIQLGNLERALEVCTAAVEAEPDDPVNHYNLAGVLALLGRSDAAFAALAGGAAAQGIEFDELCERILLINKGQAVLYGKLAEIKRQHAPNTIRVRALQIPPDLPGVKEVERDDGAYNVSLEEGAVPQAVLRALLDRGVEIESFEVAPVPLEDIFVMAVGGEEA